MFALKHLLYALLAGLLFAACTQTTPPLSLKQARQGFKTQIIPGNPDKEPALTPPPLLFRMVAYDSAVGKLAAYVTPDPKDGRKHPAIIWITGGDCNSIGNVWTPAQPDNDQTAGAFRKAGIVMMFPSLRGGNDNPGQREGFFGEVDDVLSAANFLERQDYVDPKRIYLGGHSTGGTLVLLTAECSDRFRAVFSFGPADNVAGYGADSGLLPFDTSSEKELKLRDPIRWLSTINTPVFVFEGTSRQSNIASLRAMKLVSTNPQVHFLAVDGAGHFSILDPTTRLIANKILSDTTPNTKLEFNYEELNKPFAQAVSQ